MIFQGISVARNYPAPSSILAIKRELLCYFAKSFKGRHFMGHSGTDSWIFLNLHGYAFCFFIFFKMKETLQPPF